MLTHLKILTLLCVEASRETQSLYKTIFGDIVKEIVCASSVQEGLEIYHEKQIDIIVSAYELPEQNGLEMIKIVREEDKETPLILVSSLNDIKIIVDALRAGVNNFVVKPIVNSELIKAISEAGKLLIVSRLMAQKKCKELQNMSSKDEYNIYQEKLAFEKELNILRNDFYYKMVDTNGVTLIDFMYQPLDMISGDAYSVRKVDDNRTFYLLIDGMGKGLSASLTSMSMTSFINHLVDKMLKYESFSLDMLLQESIDYIKPILLEEESLSIDYILFDHYYKQIHYAKFSMPPFLLQTQADSIEKIKSNNPPLSKWTSSYKINQYDIKNINKFLFYSDGLVENKIKNSQLTYASKIEEDFKNSFTKGEMRENFLEKIEEQEDDVTMIFIHNLSVENTYKEEKFFETSFEAVEEASVWFEEKLGKLFEPKLAIVFNELMMNAYEHGNLGLTSKEKHQLLEDDEYIEKLLELEEGCEKKILVEISQINFEKTVYVTTQISDEGKGFDTEILSSIFRNQAAYNGRGVFVSRKNSMGIYYNDKANKVLFIHKLSI